MGLILKTDKGKIVHVVKAIQATKLLLCHEMDSDYKFIIVDGKRVSLMLKESNIVSQIGFIDFGKINITEMKKDNLKDRLKEVVKKIDSSGFKKSFIAETSGIAASSLSRILNKDPLYVTEGNISKLERFFERH